MNRSTPKQTEAAKVRTSKDKDSPGDEVTALARGLTVLRAVAAAPALLECVDKIVLEIGVAPGRRIDE
ncbi:hypothetical protein BH160DRAFT_7243 [Burkholderia sp. H160]|nr:hypothetical protein BH160DRAFT_7243 [Burkholderia sp. H160]